MNRLAAILGATLVLIAATAFAGDIHESPYPSMPKVSLEDANTFRAQVKPWINAWWSGDLKTAWKLGEPALTSEPHNYKDFYEFINDWNSSFEKGYYYLVGRQLHQDTVQLLRKDVAHGQQVFYVVYSYSAQYRDVTRKQLISEEHIEHVAFLLDENGKIFRIVGIDDSVVDAKITGYSAS